MAPRIKDSLSRREGSMDKYSSSSSSSSSLILSRCDQSSSSNVDPNLRLESLFNGIGKGGGNQITWCLSGEVDGKKFVLSLLFLLAATFVWEGKAGHPCDY